jgi:hypothetical protein
VTWIVIGTAPTRNLLESGNAMKIAAMREVIFLSAPYNDPDSAVMEDRVKKVAIVASQIERSGKGHVIAPNLSNHLMVKHGHVPRETSWWASQFLTLLSRCDELWVLKLPGWDRSVGVKQEIDHAAKNHIKIRYLDPAQYGV